MVTLRGQNLEYLPEAVGPLYIGAVYSTSLFQIPGVTLQGYFLWDRLAHCEIRDLRFRDV